jgi:hypothetical protein
MTKSVRAVLTAGSALLVLLFLSTCGNTGGGPDPDVPGPGVRVTEADSGQIDTVMEDSYWVAEARYGDNSSSTTDLDRFELQIGIDETRRHVAGYQWPWDESDPVYVPFVLTLDSDGTATLSFGTPHSGSFTSIQYTVGEASHCWALTVRLPPVDVSGGEEASVSIRELRLNGTLLEQSSFTAEVVDDFQDVSYSWLVAGCDLSGGFVVSGELCFDWNTHTLPVDAPAMEIMIKQ